ncbi:hypothetical protein [Arsenicicoccus dermatophilus]|uniref:hypothetical protein n=1 Tax=Arsenicicoccus dermatophilus TaxID=1076331 RepID=UPI0039173E69
MERLADAPQCRIIDFIPYVPVGTSFSRLEDDMEVHYRPAHADKMVLLLLVLMYRYPDCVVYVEDDLGQIYQDHPGLERDRDVRDFPPEQVAAYVRDIIVNERASMSFFFPDIDCLLRLTGGFRNEIFGSSPEFDELLAALVHQHGLYLKTVTDERPDPRPC